MDIRSNSVSPCLIINVKDVIDIPSMYSDINVLADTKNIETVQNVLKNTCECDKKEIDVFSQSQKADILF